MSNRILPTISVEGLTDPISFLLGTPPHLMSDDQLREAVEKTRELASSPQSLRKELTSVKASDAGKPNISEIEL